MEQERRTGRPSKEALEQEAATATGVRRVRLALSLTQEEMAQQMMCSITSVRRFERESTLPGGGALKAQLDKLARKAGVTLEDV